MLDAAVLHPPGESEKVRVGWLVAARGRVRVPYADHGFVDPVALVLLGLAVDVVAVNEHPAVPGAAGRARA